MLWRQGDVLIESTSHVPGNAERQSHVVLADGEVTGHRHRVEDSTSAAVFLYDGEMFLEVFREQTAIVHEEHGTIRLPRGAYRVWRQREYVPPRRSFAISEGGSAVDVRD
jgi:hypothetical protein